MSIFGAVFTVFAVIIMIAIVVVEAIRGTLADLHGWGKYVAAVILVGLVVYMIIDCSN